MSRKWNLVENIEEFLRDERVRLSEREEMVPAAAPEKKKRAPAKSSEAKVDSLSADNPRLQELLETCSTATSDFVRSLDGIQRLATDISKESDLITKGDAEYGVRRSDKLQKMISEFSDYVAESYSNFAAGREAMKAVASMSGFSTTRKSAEPRGSAPKKEPTNYAAMDATKLVSDIEWMSKKLNTILLDTAKSGAAAKKMALDIAKSKDSGDALLSEIKDFVEAYLDFRDLTSGALFGLIKGFSNRLNELVMRVSQSKAGSGIMKVRAESVFQIDLSYLSEDRDFAWIAEDLHFARPSRRNQIAEAKGKGVMKVHSKDKKIVEGMCRSMVTEMNGATSSMLDEAGCAYAAMESLYEMYGEPDASYYADEEPYTGVQEGRRFGRNGRLAEAAIGKGDAAAAQKLTTMANQFEKLVKSEMGYGSDSSNSDEKYRNRAWLDTVQLLRDLSKSVALGRKQDVADLWDRNGYVLDNRNGIETFDGFENAKREIKKLIKIK